MPSSRSASRAQPRHRRVQELVHDARGSAPRPPRAAPRRAASRAQRALQLARARIASTRARRWRIVGTARSAASQPSKRCCSSTTIASARAGSRRRCSAFASATRAEVVDVVEVDVVELVDRGVDVARHGDVDHEDRPALRARAQRRRDAAGASSSGASPPVEVSTTSASASSARQLVEPVRACRRSAAPAPRRARACGSRPRPTPSPRVAQRRERRPRPSRRRRPAARACRAASSKICRPARPPPRHRHRPLGDARLGAHALGGREGALEEPAEDRAGGAALDRGAVRVLHLAEDLRLADHHRVERGRDAEHVAHRLGVAVLVERGARARAPSPAAPRRPSSRAKKERRRWRAASSLRVSATTSTRLQVESSTASSISSQATSFASAGAGSSTAKPLAQLERRACGGSCRPAGASREELHADHREEQEAEARDGAGRAPGARPERAAEARGDQHRVDAPRRAAYQISWALPVEAPPCSRRTHSMPVTTPSVSSGKPTRERERR